MCYSNKIEYEIIPTDSYQIIRNCAKCGCKMTYINTNNFRINANGNLVDVWLIYQCEKCKHTYNLTVYERIKPSVIKKEYDRFLANDTGLAKEYGNNKELFQKNKAEIDLEKIEYTISPRGPSGCETANCIIIHNPYEIKIRGDRVLAEVLSMTRKQIKQLIKEGKIAGGKNYLGKYTEIIRKGWEE